MKQIDLIGFLCNYYGIVGDNLRVNKLSHMDVKILFPNIKRVSFDELKEHYYKVYNGDIILVRDYKGNVLPYINPRLELQQIFLIESEDADKDEIDIRKIQLDKLSKEELLKLRKKLKKNQQIHDAKTIVRAIRRKKDHQVMEYKLKKKMLRMEEF